MPVSYTHLAMVSMDNCSHNGDKLYAAVNAFAKVWTDNGLVEAGDVYKRQALHLRRRHPHP